MFNYMCEEASSTEIDLLIFSAIRVDWDRVLQVPAKEIAQSINSSEKYIKHTLKKLSSRKFGRRIFVDHSTSFWGERVYKLNIGKPDNLGFDTNTSDYCKNFSFFHTAAFRNLSVHAKRVILVAAYNMCKTKSETVELNYHTFVPSKNDLANRKFTRGRLLNAIKEINESFNEFLTIKEFKTPFTKSAIYEFNFVPGTLNVFETKKGEELFLRKHIAQFGFYKPLSGEFCAEILKTARYVFNSFQSIGKEIANESNTVAKVDDLLKLARSVYTDALKKFAKSLHINRHLLDNPKEASAYFSKIIQDVVAGEHENFEKQASSIAYLHDTYNNSFVATYSSVVLAEITSRANDLSYFIQVLENWIMQWHYSRFNSVDKEYSVVTENPKTVSPEKATELKNKYISLKENFKNNTNKRYVANVSRNTKNVFDRLMDLFLPKIEARINRLELLVK